MAHAFTPSIWEAEQTDLLVGGQTGLWTEFQYSQGYIQKLCFKKPQQTKQKAAASLQSLPQQGCSARATFRQLDMSESCLFPAVLTAYIMI